MSERTVRHQDWRRFHDPAGHVERPDTTVYGSNRAARIIDWVRQVPASVRLTAAGSHWSLSSGTIPDDWAVETHWPQEGAGIPVYSGLAEVDLGELIHDELFDAMVATPVVTPEAQSTDPCLSNELEHKFFVHLKSGTRVYEAYSLLDRSDVELTLLARRLNAAITGSETTGPYCGPWAFETLGGAGGQTLVGAFTTGTHGADFHQRPIADSVLALHLVVEKGRHYWIEPATTQFGLSLTDDVKLTAHYANLAPAAPFGIIRDDDIFHAALVGAGRLGVVLSVVLRVVPQYSLHEHRRLDSWNRLKRMLTAGDLHHGFEAVHFPGTPAERAADLRTFAERFGDPDGVKSRFLQIGVNLSPDGSGDHVAGVTQRWFRAQKGGDPDSNARGRVERGTLKMAGHSASYQPPEDDSNAGGNGTFLSRACASGNFIAGGIREVAAEIDQALTEGAMPATGIAAAALGIGLGPIAFTMAEICSALAVISVLLHQLAGHIESSGDQSLAQVTDMTITAIMDTPGVPTELKLMLIRTVFYKVFTAQQSNRDYFALSYAVMDTHDYLDRSCFGNAESLEVFFDAARPDLYCAYVDGVLSFEAYQQEQLHQFSVGYVSLRYVLESEGLIAPAKFPETVVIEVAAIRDASGSVPFVMNAAQLARNRNFAAAFHWGQFNPLDRDEVQRLFATDARLERWRGGLRTLSGTGTQFSNQFTRQTGLEPA